MYSPGIWTTYFLLYSVGDMYCRYINTSIHDTDTHLLFIPMTRRERPVLLSREQTRTYDDQVQDF